GGGHFGAHRSVHDVADIHIMPPDPVLAADAFLGHERWVGGDPIEHAQVLGFLDLGETGGVDEEFHGGSVAAKVTRCRLGHEACLAGYLCRLPCASASPFFCSQPFWPHH